jgi:hypothetical protein
MRGRWYLFRGETSWRPHCCPAKAIMRRSGPLTEQRFCALGRTARLLRSICVLDSLDCWLRPRPGFAPGRRFFWRSGGRGAGATPADAWPHSATAPRPGLDLQPSPKARAKAGPPAPPRVPIYPHVQHCGRLIKTPHKPILSEVSRLTWSNPPICPFLIFLAIRRRRMRYRRRLAACPSPRPRRFSAMPPRRSPPGVGAARQKRLATLILLARYPAILPIVSLLDSGRIWPKSVPTSICRVTCHNVDYQSLAQTEPPKSCDNSIPCFPDHFKLHQLPAIPRSFPHQTPVNWALLPPRNCLATPVNQAQSR